MGLKEWTQKLQIHHYDDLINLQSGVTELIM
jgi:hypothetical protein